MTSPRLPPSQADAACGGMFKLVEGYSAETSGGLMLCLPEENAEVRCAAWCAHSGLALLVLKNGRVVRCVVCAVVCTCLSGCWGYLPPLHLSNACHIRPLPVPPRPAPSASAPPRRTAALACEWLAREAGCSCVVCGVRCAVCVWSGGCPSGGQSCARSRQGSRLHCMITRPHYLCTTCSTLSHC
jgi:hypothetical protein